MFLKIFKQVQEIEMVLLEAFQHRLYSMLFVAAIQSKMNEGLVIVDCISQTRNKAVNGGKLLVQCKSPHSSSFNMSNFFMIKLLREVRGAQCTGNKGSSNSGYGNSNGSADETEGGPSCGTANEADSRAGLAEAAIELLFELGEA